MSRHNQKYISRFDELIAEGELLWKEFKKNDEGMIMDVVAFTRWSTSSLNLLDKLSISTNRFVSQFEIWVLGGPGQTTNIGAALGVLQSARNEYACGMAIEYHLSVSAAVFDSFLDEARYLCRKGYFRASAVLLGAALEESLKARARAELIEVGPKETLNPLIHKLKAPEVGVLKALDAKKLESIVRLRNDAAHGGAFDYQKKDIEDALSLVEITLSDVLKNA